MCRAPWHLDTTRTKAEPKNPEEFGASAVELLALRHHVPDASRLQSGHLPAAGDPSPAEVPRDNWARGFMKVDRVEFRSSVE